MTITKYPVLLFLFTALLLPTLGLASDDTSELKQRADRLEKRLAQVESQHLQWKHYHHQVNKQSQQKAALTSWGTPVTTSPYLGIRPEYTGSDLLVNAGRMNEDLFILEREQIAESIMRKHGMSFTKHPVVLLSGKLESVASWIEHYDGRHEGDVDLTTTEVDLVTHINPWASSYIGVSYDNSYPDSGTRASNSNLSLERGFVTLGNLNSFPFYLTVGQMYVPFGHYSSRLVSDPFTKTLGRTKVRAALLGAKYPFKFPVSASIFAYQGNTRHQVPNTTIVGQNFENEWGANLEYKFKYRDINGQLGVSYVRNIADSIHMQNNGSGWNEAFGGFTGFGALTALQGLEHRVHGGDIAAKINIQQYTFIAEYTTALRKFAINDMSFNGYPAQPAAFHGEVDYGFPLFGRPASLACGYDRSTEAMALELPRSRISAALGVAALKDTIQGIELRQDRNYASRTAATAGGVPFISQPDTLSEQRNIALLFFGFYF